MDYSSFLTQILNRARKHLKSIKTMDWESKDGADRWSKKEILGHLIDSAYHNHRRFVEAVGAEDYIFDGYDQVAWVSINKYQQRDSEEIINTFQSVNIHLSRLIAGIDAHHLFRTVKAHNFNTICMVPRERSEPVTLSYLIWDYLYHMEHHLRQIDPNYYNVLPKFK